MTDNTAGMIGLARRAGKLELGCDCTKESVAINKTRLVLLANDCSPRLAKDFENMQKQYIFHIIRLPYSKAQLSAMLGSTDCAVCGVTDISFAAEIAKRLAALSGNDSERIISEKLALTQKRRQERQKIAKDASQKKHSKHEKATAFNREKTSHNSNGTNLSRRGGKRFEGKGSHSEQRAAANKKHGFNSGSGSERSNLKKARFGEKHVRGKENFPDKNNSFGRFAKRTAHAAKSDNKSRTNNSRPSADKRAGNRKGHK